MTDVFHAFVDEKSLGVVALSGFDVKDTLAVDDASSLVANPGIMAAASKPQKKIINLSPDLHVTV